jgi:hypothetical protein
MRKIPCFRRDDGKARLIYSTKPQIEEKELDEIW